MIGHYCGNGAFWFSNYYYKYCYEVHVQAFIKPCRPTHNVYLFQEHEKRHALADNVYAHTRRLI